MFNIYSFTEEEYYRMYKYTIHGFISEEEFGYYCIMYLEKIMNERKIKNENF